MKNLTKYLAVFVLFPFSVQAKDKLECKSFSGNWSRASIESIKNNFYKLEVKFWGQPAKVFVGKMIPTGSLEKGEYNDSAYDEAYYTFKSSEILTDDLKVDYTLTSDGANYLYLKYLDLNSSLSCKLRLAL